jgi:plasmid stabilization system protein ParE
VKFRIIISPAAARDVDRLEAWLIDKDPTSAHRIGEVLETAIASLDEMAEHGRLVSVATRELNPLSGHQRSGRRDADSAWSGRPIAHFHGRERR